MTTSATRAAVAQAVEVIQASAAFLAADENDAEEAKSLLLAATDLPEDEASRVLMVLGSIIASTGDPTLVQAWLDEQDEERS